MREKFIKEIKEVNSSTFESLALRIFKYQAAYNPLYKEYIRLIGLDSLQINNIREIPFMPIQFFKSHEIKTGIWKEENIFTSSTTTGSMPSKHYVRNMQFYLNITRVGFEQQYGSINEFCFLCLLPSYLEREGSSLVAMCDYFIKNSKYSQSGFYLNNIYDLKKNISDLQKKSIPTILIGVSFALLSLSEAFNDLDCSDIIIMETGGMKGKRKELTRIELHTILKKSLNVHKIHSEYGMTELYSQAYSKGDGLFQTTPTMMAFAREINNPLKSENYNKTGVLNIIDLANIDTCAFIATDDLVKIQPNGYFEILGRLDNSDIRGCNLMMIS